MVLPASPPHAAAGEDWLKPFQTALELSPRAILLCVENAVESRLGEFVRGLLPRWPQLDVHLDPKVADNVPEGSTLVLVPSERDAEWLNGNRTIFRQRSLRVVLWCDATTTRLLPQLAPDFRDWISHSRPCPPAIPGDRYSLLEASHRLRQIGSRRPELLAARLDLERGAIDAAIQRLRSGELEEDVAGTLEPQRVRLHGTVQGVSEATATLSVSKRSPFVVGAPLERGARCFVGRSGFIRQIQNSLELGQPVQILGERRMGKTSLLNQVPQWLPEGMPWVQLNAQGHSGTSEHELVRALAEGLGRDEVARAVGGSALSATAALERLVPCALLLDDADAMARPGHAFTPSFFEGCRALGQNRQLLLVCTARTNVAEGFQDTGLTSAFLNDSRRVWVGQLEEEAREALLDLAPNLSAEQRAAALREAAGFAMGLQWMGEAGVMRGLSGEEAGDHLREEMKGCFKAWWKGRSESEHRLLLRAERGVERRQLSDGERRGLRALVARGLAEERDGGFGLPGAAWQDFVRDR